MWLRPATKSDRVDHYQHAMLYTDDILAIIEEPEKFIRKKLGKLFIWMKSLSDLQNNILETKSHSLHLKMVLNVGSLVHFNMLKLSLRM